MHVVLWRFRVRTGREQEFEAAYASGGAWTTLFQRNPAYRGSDLMRATDGTYLTMDRWDSAEAYDAFRAQHAAEYERIDAASAALLDEEERLGAVDI